MGTTNVRRLVHHPRNSMQIDDQIDCILNLFRLFIFSRVYVWSSNYQKLSIKRENQYVNIKVVIILSMGFMVRLRDHLNDITE